jgi:hypothetical protein
MKIISDTEGIDDEPIIRQDNSKEMNLPRVIEENSKIEMPVSKRKRVMTSKSG